MDNNLTQHNITAFIQDIFERRGHEEYLGEPVTMAEHMLQSAALAEQEKLEEIIVVAALLHDIGHFTSEFGMYTRNDEHDRFHETAGAQVLEPFFPKLVTDCVRYHVAAKRYLCAVNAEYLNQLSAASVHSLSLQGGPMDRNEISAFEMNENLDNIIQVRLFDDGAKDASVNVPAFSHYAPMVQRVVNAHCS